MGEARKLIMKQIHHKPTSVMSSLESSPTRFLTSSPARSNPRQPVLSWTEAESKIRKLHQAGLDGISEDQSWRLYQLELSASRRAGESPQRVLEQAKAVLSTG